jgi:hypothetical protein
VTRTQDLVRVWVDFNELTPSGQLTASLRELSEVEVDCLDVGNVVIAYDSDGNTCDAHIDSFEYPLARITVLRDTWVDADVAAGGALD